MYNDNDAAFERCYLRTMNRGGRRYPCPTCQEPNRLTKAEKDKGYQCQTCADRAEGLVF